MEARNSIRALTILAFLLLAVLPVAYMYVSSYYASSYSLERYTWILKDHRQQDIFIRTVCLGLGVMLLSILFGVLAAVLLEYSNIPCRQYFRVLLIVSLLIPPYISAMSYLAFMGKNWVTPEIREPVPEISSMVRRDTMAAGNDTSLLPNKASVSPGQRTVGRPWYLPFDINPYTLEYAILSLSLSFYPLVYLMTSSALRNVDPRLEDAALLVRSPPAVVARITLPLVLPQTLAAGLLVFIFAVSDLGVPSVYRVNTLAMEVFSHFTGFYDTGQALALSFPLLVSIAVLIIALKRILKDRPFYSLSSQEQKSPIVRLSFPQKIASLGFVSALALFSAVIPVALLFLQSEHSFPDALGKASDSILNSLFLAALCASLMLLPAFFYSYFFQKKAWADYLALFPLIAPSAALGIGMIAIWNNDYTAIVYGTFLVLAAGYLARFLPFAIKAVAPFLEQIPPAVEESARLTGASFTKIVSEILLPLSKTGLISAWLVGFILCMRELELSVMLTPPGFQTLPNRIFTLYHYGEIGMTCALSLFLIVIVLIPYILLWSISRQNALPTIKKGE